MTKIITIVKNGKRVDMPIEKFQKVLEDVQSKVEKKEENPVKVKKDTDEGSEAR
jgi:hypothetical protein